MSRAGLVAVTALAASMASGCAGQPPAPQWRDPVSPVPVPSPVVASLVASEPVDGPSSAGTATDDGVAAPIAPARSSGPDSADGPVTGEARFLEAVRGQLPEVAVDRRNEEITELGGQACASLTAGQARAEVATKMIEYGVGASDARRLVSLARSTLCRN